MANDIPTLRGYTFSKSPDNFQVWYDKVIQSHTLSDGSIRQFVKGFKLKFKFGWSKNWLNEADYSAIVAIYNDPSGMNFIPRPNTHTGFTATILLTNDFNITPWKDLLEGTGYQSYEGTIEGEAVGVTATAVSW